MTETLPPRSPPTARHDARLLLRNGISYPLFVPDLGQRVVDLLKRGAHRELVEDLRKRIAVGSDNAASFLAFLSIYGIDATPETIAEATDKCLLAAKRNDAYAQFVAAWLCKKRGEDARAFELMLSSATKGLFLPAFIDVGRFMVGGTGVRNPDLSAALSVFREAHQLGHRAALLYWARLMMKGVAGWIYAPIGAMLLLPALLRAHWYARRNPLSERIFVTPVNPRRPLIKGLESNTTQI